MTAWTRRVKLLLWDDPNRPTYISRERHKSVIAHLIKNETMDDHLSSLLLSKSKHIKLLDNVEPSYHRHYLDNATLEILRRARLD